MRPNILRIHLFTMVFFSPALVFGVTLPNSFSSGNAAVAADVNANFNVLRDALNNNLNSDGWGKTGSDIGYTAGRLGVGTASPGALFQINQTVNSNAGGLRLVNGAVTTYMYGDAAGRLHFDNSTSEMVLNEGGGNVGIRTASPLTGFHVNVTAPAQALFGSSLTNAIRIYPDTEPALIWDSSTNLRMGTMTAINAGFSEKLRILTNGNVGINSASPAEILDVGGNVKSSGTVMINAAAGNARKIEIYTNNLRRWNLGADGGTESTGTQVGSDFEIRRFQDSGGAFGNTIVLKITRSNGLLQLPLYNTGTLTSDASGNITVSSDGRMKDIVGKTETGLSEVLQMHGKRWRWKPGMGMETQGVYEGFIAQDVERLVPLAVGGKADGMKSLAYHSLLPTFANAIRELKSEKDREVLSLRQENEKLKLALAEQQKRLTQEATLRQQQDLRLTQLEQNLERVAQRLDNSRQAVARR